MRFLLPLILSTLAAAQNPDWFKPFPAHRVIGPVYYVGTADLACFLITSPQGHILINSGDMGSAALIRKSVESLGFKMSDIKILLTMQGHGDHVAGLADLKKESGAKFFVTEADKAAVESGGIDDINPRTPENQYPPVKADRILKDGETLSIGHEKLKVHLTPGHTKGSVSYTMAVPENNKNYNVCFANMQTIVVSPLVNNPKYPNMVEDYAKGFRVQKALSCDIFLAAHGSQYGMKEKYKQTYNPETFVDPDGYKKAVLEYESAYVKRLEAEQAKK